MAKLTVGLNAEIVKAWNLDLPVEEMLKKAVISCLAKHVDMDDMSELEKNVTFDVVKKRSPLVIRYCERNMVFKTRKAALKFFLNEQREAVGEYFRHEARRIYEDLIWEESREQSAKKEGK